MSKPSQTDKRYQRYADIFGNPQDAEVIERGERALHWEFTEAWKLREAVANRAQQARDKAGAKMRATTPGDAASEAYRAGVRDGAFAASRRRGPQSCAPGRVVEPRHAASYRNGWEHVYTAAVRERQQKNRRRSR